MTYFELLRKQSFDKLSKIENVEVLSDKEKKESNKWFEKFEEVWSISRPVETPEGGQKELTFLLCFMHDFPVSLPDVFLNESSYKEVKHIPHVDTNRFVCTIDKALATTNIDKPFEIIEEVLLKARQIIENGIAQKNFSDFTEEFLSYWENQYGNENDVNTEVLSFITVNPSEIKVTLISLEKRFRGFKHILFQNNKEAQRFKVFLDEHNMRYVENDVFYIDQDLLNDRPPYHINCHDSVEIIKHISDDIYHDFKKYLNNNSAYKLILFKKRVNRKDHYLGWFYPSPKSSAKGFSGKLSALKAMSTKGIQGHKYVFRISPKDFTHERVMRRSSGYTNDDHEKKFAIAGLGSVGSHLVHFLSGFQGSEFILFDPDLLTIENTGRHLLGFEHVRANKAKAIKEYLVRKNPKLKVNSYDQSVLNYCNKETKLLNNSDFLFLAVGKQNVETYIVDLIKKGTINIPTFIFWVEPYLAGGHCIYIDPDNVRYEEFYETTEERKLFKFNVIKKSEYLRGNELFKMKEASCQSSYMPYSGSNVIYFLSQLYPFLWKKISNSDTQKSKAYTWVGDFNMLDKMGIELSDYYQVKDSFNIIEHKL
ncbi:E2/UBC family protein [Salibacter halophilus]|uniref:Uncharacterized protein n=1 Tax=Salibacter halophilus TaxID=1803916 RepID=A0A6N6M477_9FLAO|nr:E2/UBC family protein [Salibacter halophilus]KAB1064090.1 hypothetical protein F3059_08650 [Salibacter halophilus]